MTRSHVGAVAAATGVEVFTEAGPISGAGRFMAVVTASPAEDTEDTELPDVAMDIVR
jgi:hypothetical protein